MAAVFGLAVSYLLVLGLDRLFDTPSWLRGTLLLLGAAVPGLGLPLKWHRWVWRQRRLEDAARLLRWKFPRLGDQLLGIVELAKQDSAAGGRSERLVQAAMAQADEAVKDQDFSDAVPRAKHRQWALAAAGVSAVTVAGFVTINDAARNAFVRWILPWGETERFTFARVEKLPDPLVVPLAEAFTLPVQLSGDTRWNPDTALGAVSGQPDISAALHDGHYALSFPPQKSDAELFVKVGDVRETIALQPRPRPELTSLSVQLKLPDYLQYKTEPVTEVRGGAVSLLKGAQATFTAAASRTLAHAEIDGKPAGTQGEKLISPAQPVAAAAQEVTFTWKDTLGLAARVPLVLKVNPVDDEAPKLVARRESLEQVVLDSEVVVFDLSSSDDFGIRQAGLEWKNLDDGTDATATTTAGSKVAAAGAPEMKQLDARATFCAVREGVEPQSLEVRAWAEDYLPGRERSRSASFVLHVLNQTDHALWVTQQMGKWLEAAKETYEREQQLHETNKELRAMSAAELDRPENRRRVAQQAAAESANAERLNSLNQSGRQLVEHATKNSEFDATRLESWATMLKSLQDIASNRMPGVSDLLKQSADAKADAAMAQNAQNGQKNPSQGENPSSGQNQQSQPGDPKNAQAQNSQNSPANQQNPDGKQGVPQDGKSAPQLSSGPQTPKSGGPPNQQDPNAKQPDKAPSISLTESTMNKPDETAGQKPAPPKPPGAGKLSLPGNSLAAAPGQKPQEDQAPESSSQQSLDQAVKDQRELLAEFARVSDQLGEILGSLEASTFVKRFKAASREQTQLASGISQQTLDAFGVLREVQPAPVKGDPEKEAADQTNSAPGALIAGFVEAFVKEYAGAEDVDAAEIKEAEDKEEQKEETVVAAADPFANPAEQKPAAKKAEKKPEAPFVTTFAPQARTKSRDQSEVVKVIQGDLEAYAQRKPDQHFKKVLGEMKQVRVVDELKKVGDRAADNFSGNAIHGAEFWADTMDRWAEEMVKAGKCSSCSSCSGDSLPPEIILKVMQALRDEMKLRDETRELDKARPAIEKDEFATRAGKLSTEQDRIAKHTEGAIDDIVALPSGSQKFGKELQLLSAVVEVMAEAGGILGSPDAGPPAVAAETEAIELLLQTKRQNPKGGGGGGGNPGGGSTAGSASSAAALADIGPGSDAASAVSARPVGQATGRAGREFPEEFRSGLDAYFSNLEGTGNRP